MRLLKLLLILFVCAAGPAGAGPFEDGIAAYSRGDYATAFRLYRPLAEQGYAGAQINLGLMYANGQGVPQDYAAAVSWYRKAAEQGNAPAQFNLGLMYDNGRTYDKRSRGAHSDDCDHSFRSIATTCSDRSRPVWRGCS